MPSRNRPPLAIALTWLRERADMSQVQLGDALGISGSQISAYEKGTRNLKRYRLEELVAIMGFDSADIDFILLVISALPAPSERTAGEGAAAPPPDFIVRRTAVELAADVSLLAEYCMQKQREAHRIVRDRERAGQLWKRLAPLTHAQRCLLIERAQGFQSWALAERLAEESDRAAPKSTAAALNLAQLAVITVRHAGGSLAWRSRLEGYARAFLANALRVSGSPAKASGEWTRVWQLWDEGASGDPAAVLPEWRLLDLEASLRRDTRKYEAALELLDRAAAGAPRSEAGRILVTRAEVLSQVDDVAGAVSTLRQAQPLVCEPRLKYHLAYNLSINLCAQGKFAEAAALLPKIRQLALDLRNEDDLTLALWLSGRIAVGQGDRHTARAAFEQVRDHFAAKQDGVTTALIFLDVAVLYLEDDRLNDLHRLAVEMRWILATEDVGREALAALRLFCEAARQNTATVDQARVAQRLLSPFTYPPARSHAPIDGENTGVQCVREVQISIDPRQSPETKSLFDAPATRL